MSKLKLESICSGPTVVSGDASSTFTLATCPLADLTRGMADGDSCHVDVDVTVIYDYDYSALVTLTTCVKYNAAGPSWNLGSVSTHTVNAGLSSPINSGLTLDQSSGLLRVRAVLGSIPVKCYAVFSTIGGVQA